VGERVQMASLHLVHRIARCFAAGCMDQ
jgi:hypothetical protein